MLQLAPTTPAPATHRLATVTVIMLDIDTNEQCERTICASNVRVADTSAAIDSEGDVLGTIEEQRRLLNGWIVERAWEQHNALLELVDWKLNYLPLAA